MMTQNNYCGADDYSNTDLQLSLTMMYQGSKDYLYHKSLGQQQLSAEDSITVNLMLLKTTIGFEVSDRYFLNLYGILDSNYLLYKLQLHLSTSHYTLHLLHAINQNYLDKYISSMAYGQEQNFKQMMEVGVYKQQRHS